MTAIRSSRVVLPGGMRPAAIHVAEGRIAAVTGPGEVKAGEVIHDVDDLVVFPGLVDTHVHVNDPGRADWEGFSSATAAAAAGGTTTLVDMPLNSIPPTTTLAGLEAKLDAASGRCAVDVGFWGGIVPGNSGQLASLAGRGVLGFKAFLVDSGVPEFPPVTAGELASAMELLARLGTPALVHAEDPAELAEPGAAFAALPAAERRRYARYLDSRPGTAEAAAVVTVAAAASATGAFAHILHVSAAAAAGEVARARAAGARLSAETCPHYLVLSDGDVAQGATEFKCAPPIRGEANRLALWESLRRGHLAMVVSDHSPSPQALKATETGDFGEAWGGISSLQLRLSATWTGLRAVAGDLGDLVGWLALEPARLAGLADRKGAIAPGRDADLVVWDPDEEFVVDPAQLRHRHPITPYAGRTMAGVVHRTYLRGEIVFDRRHGHSAPAGRMLLGRSAPA